MDNQAVTGSGGCGHGRPRFGGEVSARREVGRGGWYQTGGADPKMASSRDRLCSPMLAQMAGTESSFQSSPRISDGFEKDTSQRVVQIGLEVLLKRTCVAPSTEDGRGIPDRPKAFRRTEAQRR